MSFITLYRFGLSVLLCFLAIGIEQNISGEYNTLAQGILGIVMPLLFIVVFVLPFIIKAGWKEYKKVVFSKVWLVFTLALIVGVVWANV